MRSMSGEISPGVMLLDVSPRAIVRESKPQLDLTFAGGLGRHNPRLSILEMLPTELGTLKRKLGRAEDGRRYVLLSNSSPRAGAALNEYYCSRVADECGVPVPPFGTFKSQNQVYFGSRYACGKLGIRELRELRHGKSLENIRQQLSSIYAFDQLLANTDRSHENLLLLSEDDWYVIEAIDFSEAAHFGEDWNAAAMLRDNCTSTHTFNAYFSQFSFDRASAERVINRLLQMRNNFIDECTAAAPPQWVSASEACAKSWAYWWRNVRLPRSELLFKKLRPQ
ncbi:MAG: hypothetical protein JWR16_1147 [Nevskia sp.]|nr:hypothetical protein [Nevskia sp.]